MMSFYQSVLFLIIGLVLYVAGQDQYFRWRRPQHSSRPADGGIPSWCPPRSPRIRCFANPCDVERCPSYPQAICLNDHPCEPSCKGHFYVEGRNRLTRSECHGGAQSSPGLPAWCPNETPLQCFFSPCTTLTCPRYPEARCLADDPCNPGCIGNFYLRRQNGRGRKLSQAECYSRRRQ